MSWLSRIFGSRMSKKKASVAVLGASKAGKTTLICYLETGEPVLEDPRTTLGIDIRESPINISGWALSAIDVGGQDLYRKSLWGLGVSQADGIIYVIDGTIKPDTSSSVNVSTLTLTIEATSPIDAGRIIKDVINKRKIQVCLIIVFHLC